MGRQVGGGAGGGGGVQVATSCMLLQSAGQPVSGGPRH